MIRQTNRFSGYRRLPNFVRRIYAIIYKLLHNESISVRLASLGGLSMGLSIASLLIGFLLSLVIGHSFGAEALGTFQYAIHWLTLLATLSGFGFTTLAVREFAITSSERNLSLMRGFLRFTTIGTIALSVSFSALALVLHFWLSPKFDPQLALTVPFVAAALPLFAIARLHQQSLRGLNQVIRSQLPDTLLRPLLLLLLVPIPVLFNAESDGSRGLLVLQWLVLIVVALVSWEMLRKALPPLHSKPLYRPRPWIRAGSRFAAIDLVQVLSHRSDLLVLGLFADPMWVGIYAVTHQLANLVNLPLMAGNLVLAPQVARDYRGYRATAPLARLVENGTGIVFVTGTLMVLGLLMLDNLVLGLWGTEFEAGVGALWLLLAGHLINLFFSNNALVLNMTGHEQRVLRTTAAAALIGLLLSLWLIPLYGIVGAASANAITNMLWNLLLAIHVIRHTGLDPTPFGLLRWIRLWSK